MAKSPPSARQILAANLIRLRKERGWTQEALAFECGLHRTYIGDIERHARNVTIDNIEKLAIALEIEPWALLKSRQV